MELARRSGVAQGQLVEVYYLALLRFVGCTADASDTAELVGGDDIGFVAGMAPGFLGSAREQLRGLASSTGADLPALRRTGRMLRMLADVRGPRRAIAGHCDAAQHLSRRMGVEPGVTEALRLAFERWDGKGIPGECAGEAVPASVRVVQAARDIDLWVRIGGVASATEVIARRAGRAYDPAVAAAFTADPGGVLDAVTVPDPWQAALAAEPEPHVLVPGEQLTAILHAFAWLVSGSIG